MWGCDSHMWVRMVARPITTMLLKKTLGGGEVGFRNERVVMVQNLCVQDLLVI